MATRHGEISPFDHGPYVVVAAYIMMVAMILFVLTRLITKALAIRALQIDDYFIIAGAVSWLLVTVADGQHLADRIQIKASAIVQTLVIHGAVKNSLGRHRTSLTDLEFDQRPVVPFTVMHRIAFQLYRVQSHVHRASAVEQPLLISDPLERSKPSEHANGTNIKINK